MAMAEGRSTVKDEADPASQVQMATIGLLRLLHDSSPCQNLEKLPKDLSTKLPSIRNTGSLLHQMPSVVISLDTSLDNAIQSAKHLGEIKEILATLNDGKKKKSDSSR